LRAEFRASGTSIFYQGLLTPLLQGPTLALISGRTADNPKLLKEARELLPYANTQLLLSHVCQRLTHVYVARASKP